MFLSLAMISCTNSDKTEIESKKTFSENSFLGSWLAQEMENGVKCIVTFSTKNRMSQYYESSTGANKTRPCTWHISQDTLYVQEQTGESKLFIEEVTDSLIKLRTIDSILVSFAKVNNLEERRK